MWENVTWRDGEPPRWCHHNDNVTAGEETAQTTKSQPTAQESRTRCWCSLHRGYGARTYATYLMEECSLYIYKVYIALVLFSSKYFNVLQMITICFSLDFRHNPSCLWNWAEHKHRRTDTMNRHVGYNHDSNMILRGKENARPVENCINYLNGDRF